MRSETAELEKLRDAFEAIAEATPEADDSGRISISARTVSGGSYPTAAARVYKCEILHVFGAETEGAAPTKTAVGDYVFAANVGAAVPPVGQEILLARQAHRWTFQYD